MLVDEVAHEVAQRSGDNPDRQMLIDVLAQVGQEIDVLSGRSFRPAGDFFLGFGGAQVAFGLVGGGRDAGVGDKAEHVGFAVAQVFQQFCRCWRWCSRVAPGRVARSASPAVTAAR
jgi:hypothetical protein